MSWINKLFRRQSPPRALSPEQQRIEAERNRLMRQVDGMEGRMHIRSNYTP